MSKNSTYIMPTYGDRNLEFKEGQGCYLTSVDNNKYLDFGSGIVSASIVRNFKNSVKQNV